MKLTCVLCMCVCLGVPLCSLKAHYLPFIPNAKPLPALRFSRLQPPAEPAKVEEFDDGFTTTHFGDAVTVTTFLGIPQVGRPQERCQLAGLVRAPYASDD